MTTLLTGGASIADAQVSDTTKKVEPVATITIDPAVTHGVWEGWGTSLAWWANVFGARDDIADLFFTTRDVVIDGVTLPALGMNIARYNAGACSWNEIDGKKMVVSKHIPPHRQMEGFWLDGKNADPNSASWNWSVDAKQRDMLLKARKRGANRFELFSNSPMWWMCSNLNPSGANNGAHDNLAPEHYGSFATYLATIARRAKDKWGLTFTTVEPFNEPISTWWSADSRQEGCHFSHQAQAAVLKELRSAMDKQGLKKMTIAASDENAYDQSLSTWNSFDAATKKIVGQINVHGYQETGGRRDLVYEAAKRDGKPLWNTEYGENDTSGLKMAHCINLDFRYLRQTAWSYWQPLDGSNWGLFDSDLPKGIIGKVNPKYYVLAQYSRHIRPEMTILESSDANNVVAYSAKQKKLVIVTLNQGAARRWKYDLSRFNIGKRKVVSRITEPKATARYQLREGLRVEKHQFEVDFPADSIQTFEFSEVTIKD